VCELLLRLDRAGFLLQIERFIEIIIVETTCCGKFAVGDPCEQERSGNRYPAADCEG